MSLSRTPPPTRTQAGFSLLEAMVAIALLTAVSAAIYAWAAALVSQELQMDRIQQEEALREEVLALLSSANVATHTRQQGDFDTCRWRWDAKPVGGPRRSSAYPFGLGDFEVTPYRVNVAVDATSADCLAAGMAFSLDTVGWRRISPYRETP
jgi:prepilin-type N-terminal cleavage/methylation domain-containing protein